MALSAAEEALVRDLIAQNAALLSLASSEPTIISKLGATKATLSDLTVASSLSDTDLFLVRQGTTDKSVPKSLIADGFAQVNGDAAEVFSVAAATAATHAVRFDQFGASLGAAGWQRLPSGLILQWGSFTYADIGGSLSTNVTFPISFPSAVRGVWPVVDTAQFSVNPTINNLTLTSCNIVVREGDTSALGGTVRWFAIGN